VAREEELMQESTLPSATEFDLGELELTLDRVRRFTMVPTLGLIDLAQQVRAVLRYDIPGDFVECGVWRGGASLLIADLLHRAGVKDRKVWMFDTFEGIPPPSNLDGEDALAWTQDTESPWYFNNLRVSEHEVKAAAEQLGLTAYVEIVKGLFEETLPPLRTQIGPLALLRIDADWHASVRCCLENLYDAVADRGIVILDDYYTWDGCAIATHEFLAARKLPHRLAAAPPPGGVDGCPPNAVICKGKETWPALAARMRAGEGAADAIEAMTPVGSTLILVDDEAGEIRPGGNRRLIPFLEKDGVYWGAPESGEQAISALERLRGAGAGFIAFAWSSFWWLEHYPALSGHLRASYPCLVEDDRIVLFDIR
jgi:O-methyltransferase